MSANDDARVAMRQMSGDLILISPALSDIVRRGERVKPDIAERLAACAAELSALRELFDDDDATDNQPRRRRRRYERKA